MTHRLRLAPTEQVASLRERIEYWRKTRTRRCPMPMDLWDGAAALAQVHGVHPIARMLGLSYGSLKCQMVKRIHVRINKGT